MITTEKKRAIHDLKFDGIYIDIPISSFHELGFSFGDSVDLYFSNGNSVLDVPYYDGYYKTPNGYVLCGYSSYPSPCLSLQGSGAWQAMEMRDDIEYEAEVFMHEKGKYRKIQEAFRQFHPSNREYYVSDEAFCNFRPLKASNLKEDFIYRGGSPICNDFGFMETCDRLLQEKHINYVLNLSETRKELDEMIRKCDENCISSLYSANKILPLDLSAFPRELSYARKIVYGLNEMTRHEGPVYIHCMEGKDRTGFLSILLLALSDGTMEDFEKDYMETYANFYYIDKISCDERYELIKEHYLIDRLMNELCDTSDIKDFSGYDFKKAAIQYLRYGGMKDEEIQDLIRYIQK